MGTNTPQPVSADMHPSAGCRSLCLRTGDSSVRSIKLKVLGGLSVAFLAGFVVAADGPTVPADAAAKAVAADTAPLEQAVGTVQDEKSRRSHGGYGRIAGRDDE
jgi:hypothetical protein